MNDDEEETPLAVRHPGSISLGLLREERERVAVTVEGLRLRAEVARREVDDIERRHLSLTERLAMLDRDIEALALMYDRWADD